MYEKNSKEYTVALALNSLSHYMAQVAGNPTLSIDEKMRTLQWIYKKIPEINKLLIKIKTERVNPRNPA
jgi:hypothetical protein